MPKANPDTGATFVNESLVLDVLANDVDFEGDTLSIVSVSTVSGGSVQISSDNLTLVVLPSADSTQSVTFSYTITDGMGGTDTANVELTVSAKPEANDDYVSINEDTPTIIQLLNNDMDLDGETITILNVYDISGGSAEVSTGATTVLITPPLNSNETISFKYTISDSQNLTATANVYVSINPTNDIPIARADFGFTEINQNLIIDVLSNDYDVDNDDLSITNLELLSGGAAQISSDNLSISVTPDLGSTDQINFIYTISDGSGGTATAIVSIGVGQAELIEPHYGISMMLISSGSFMMGSPDTDLDASASEKPQHEVTITKDFYLSKYEVTQGQWEAVIDSANPWPGTTPSSTYGQSTSHPAYYVSWNDINQVGGFLDKLNEASGCDTSVLPSEISTRYHPDNVPSGCYRLPTEAEWEYAARAGTTTRFSYGDDNGYSQLSNYAWYFNNSYVLGISHPDYGTHPVGQKSPNSSGLYDIYGNVNEWTYDWYDNYTSESKFDSNGPSTGSQRVLRGGSWYSTSSELRSANRVDNGSPDFQLNTIGFRLLLVK